MKYLPLGLDIHHRTCVVVGGGSVGTRKVKNLLRAGGSVVLISPEATRELMELTAEGRISWVREPYDVRHLHGAFLAVAATDNRDVNTQVVDDAGMGGVLVCDASAAGRSQIIFGALHKGKGVTVAVFTDGENPSGARAVRDQLATFLSGSIDPGPPTER